MLEFFENLELNTVRLVRFIENQLHCGLMQRSIGSDEMIWSRGVFVLLGLDPAAVKPSFSLLQQAKHPDDRLTIDEIDSSYDAASTISRKFRIIRSDGSLRVLAQHGEVLFNAAGKREKLVSVIIDVTDQEFFREQAERIAARRDAFAIHSGLFLCRIRPDGFVTHLPGHGREYEVAEERYGGQNWRNLIHPDDSEESILLFSIAAQDKVPISREHRIKQVDGSFRWHRETRIPVFNRRQEMVELLLLSQDIEKEKNIDLLKDASKQLTGTQVRMGRAAVRWTVQELAEKAAVSPSTIRRIEEFDGVTENASEALANIRKTLCSTGMEFIFPPGGKPGVRPK